MRIGLDGSSLLSPKTGVGHYTFELARALALLSPTDRFELIAPRPFPESVIEDICSCRAPNLRAVSPPPTLINRRWWTVGLPLYVRQAALDLFHGTNFEIPLWNKRRSVLTIHDLSSLLHPDKHERHIARRARRRLPLMVRAAGLIITPTQSVKREVVDHLAVDANRIVVTPEAARRTFQPAAPDRIAETKQRLGVEDDFILFVGTIEPRKNLTTLLQAFARVLDQTRSQPQLVIAGGEGWLTDNLFSGIQDSSLRNRLRLTGYLPDKDLCALYSACKVSIYPSVYEGFGLPPLEAMACGAPVIASRIPVFEETLGNAARLVDPRKVDEISKCIDEILLSADERQKLSALGRQRAAEFSWERTARLTLATYRQLLSKNAH